MSWVGGPVDFPDYTQILRAAWNTASTLTVEVVVGRNMFHFRGDQEEAPGVSRGD